MKLLMLLLLVASLTMVSCAGKKQSSEDQDAEVSEVSDDMLEEDSEEEVVISDSDEEILLSDEEEDSELAYEESSEEAPAEMAEVEEEAPVVANSMSDEYSPAPVASNGPVQSYRVQRGDTLMLIAWKIYGDYAKWKELARLNSGNMSSGYTLKAGSTISYNAPATEFSWNPEGTAYLIVRGDTLGVISNKVYGTANKWRGIWHNNKPLIKDPNLIFAGFTIYYPEDQRGVANE